MAVNDTQERSSVTHVENEVGVLRRLYHTRFLVRAFVHLFYAALGLLSAYFSFRWHSWIPLTVWFSVGLPVAFVVLRPLPGRKFSLHRSVDESNEPDSQ